MNWLFAQRQRTHTLQTCLIYYSPLANPVSTYLREVFESCEGNHLTVSVYDGYSQVGCLYEFQYIWIGVDTTVYVVFTNLDQVYNGVKVVRISASQNDALKVEVRLLLHLLVRHLLSFYHRVASMISLCLFHSFTKSAFL